ncbi:MAG: restriction endonuclease subunit S [Desulfobulbaceae bacterium]|nr:restriction endonuclease subunit S [Desulfobulbaceae bacterium]
MLNLITEHIDIWTAAQTQKTNRGRGRGKNSNDQSPHGIKKLRELILELAVRGKLVPQNPTDEPATVLLEKIAKEKARLVKKGEIKKQKKLPKINEDEEPFELSNGWQWVRLQDVSTYIQRGKGPKYAEHGKVQVISQKCIQWSGFDLSKARFVDDDSLNSYQPERFLENNDLLWNSTGTGTVGRINVIKEVSPNTLVADSHVTVIRPLQISSDFLWCYIAAPGIQLRIEPEHEKSLVSGTTKQVELNTRTVHPLLVPIPPLLEQHRIVAKVDELMALCDQLEQQQTDSSGTHQALVETLLTTLTNATDQGEFVKAWQRIANYFDTMLTTEQSIDQLKQTILQLAVMGKLVPQNPNDEPASVLLEKIAKEKARLIKEGKIKKQKPLPEINDDEKPFELPERWEWARIGDASIFTEYGMSEKTFDGIDGIPVLKMGDIQDGKVILGGQKLVQENVEGLPSLFLKKWDLLYNRTNSSELVGKTGIYDGPDDAYTFASYLIRIRCSEECVNPIYLNQYMNTPLFRVTQIEPHLKQQCGQANVNGTIMRNMIVPVPPIGEQQRIVAKVDELVALCDTFKARLIEAKETQFQLADTIVEQAVA